MYTEEIKLTKKINEVKAKEIKLTKDEAKQIIEPSLAVRKTHRNNSNVYKIQVVDWEKQQKLLNIEKTMER